MRSVTPLPILICSAFCLLWLLASPAHAERRVALVIGNGAYKDAPLRNPVNDARDMTAELRKLGFEVILRENANLRQMEDALDQFWANIRQGGTGLFFFAGHGLQMRGANYLVPVDARILVEQDVRSVCLDANKVLGRMENAGNGLNIILLDACRNNPFARSWRSAEAGLAKMDAPTGTLIGYATAPDSVAADGSGRNGVYTQHLLTQMRVPGQGIETMLKRVRVGVLQDTGRRQTPWESSSLTGDFYFNDGGAPAGQAPLLSVAQPKFDAKAEKQRLAEEAVRLRREQEALVQMQAIQAEKDRLEAERQRLEQAKLLAMAPRPKQAPQTGAAQAGGALAGVFAQLGRGDVPRAREAFERALQVNATDAEARAGLTIALVFAGREGDALFQAQRLSESGLQAGSVRLARALMLGLKGDQDAAYQFGRAVEEGADRALTALCQATAELKTRRFDKAEATLDDYLALVPEQERGAYPAELKRGLEPMGRLAGVYSFKWADSGTIMGCGTDKFLVRFARSGDVLTAASSSQFTCSVRVLGIRDVQFDGSTLRFVIQTPGLFSTCNSDMILNIPKTGDEARGTREACLAGSDPIIMLRERDQRQLPPSRAD